jgi:hypothetical protein
MSIGNSLCDATLGFPTGKFYEFPYVKLCQFIPPSVHARLSDGRPDAICKETHTALSESLRQIASDRRDPATRYWPAAHILGTFPPPVLDMRIIDLPLFLERTLPSPLTTIVSEETAKWWTKG